jgi:hypothetical protein
LVELLKERVVDPQVDVPPPVLLAARGGDVGDRALVHLRGKKIRSRKRKKKW